MNIFQSLTFRRFLLVLVSIILTLCLVEFPAFIHVVDYQRLIGPPELDLFASTNVNDPELLHVHRPHSRYSGAARGGTFAFGHKIPRSDRGLYRWDLQYDHNGFRNETDLKSADIVVIGDSFVEGVTIPASELMTAVLAQLQGKVVANLGQLGYGPSEELVVLKRYGLPLQPRTVIWMFSEVSDLGDVLHYQKVISAMRQPAQPPKPRTGFWADFWERSFTRSALRQLRAQYRIAMLPSGAASSATIRAPNGLERTVYFSEPAQALSEWELRAVDETSRTVAAANQLCAARRARFVFVFIPTAFRAMHTLCQFSKQSECRNWVPNDLPERMRRMVVSVSRDIGYLDLTPHLTQAARMGALPYYADDCHWSPEGNRIAAEAINDYLRSSQRP